MTKTIAEGLKSSCCQSSYKVEGGTTQYYVCEKCGKACDATSGMKPIAEQQYQCLECKQLFLESEVDEDADCLKCPKCLVCYTQPAYSMPVFLGRYQEYPEIKIINGEQVEIWNRDKQPENSKTFTLEQVQQIAREAVKNASTKFIKRELLGNSVMWLAKDLELDEKIDVDFNTSWWAKKKQELVK